MSGQNIEGVLTHHPLARPSSIPQKLMTPTDVAELLQISEKTVYKHSKVLFGFRPAGLGILRFRREIIHGIMEGQDPRHLALQFPVSRTEVCKQRVPHKKRSSSGYGGKAKRVKKPASADPYNLL